jgi:uncharacterized radical SAM superfamily Fe-S cluster-containing enzyme
MLLNRIVGTGVAAAASVGWHAFQAFNRLFPEGKIQPRWADTPLMKSRERTFPTLGFPRETDSLCPRCVVEVREKILAGEVDWRVLIDGKPGEIRAKIVEEDGQVFMVKECEKHGAFKDLMAMDAWFLKRMEQLYPGRDLRMSPDSHHDHGSSTVMYGRGAVLTVDLTNRCNMMCDPCFMDANQVGYVHELTWEEIKQILDNAIEVKPRRQMSVQFSGGEPTISPYFLDAVAYCRKLGYQSVQAATNGIRFAQDFEYTKAARRAGLRLAYLQFDGVTNEANSHRGVSNLFDVKKKAIENLKAAGIDITLVVTIVNSINNDQVGPIVKMAIENVDKINAISFQPVSFTGRDEEISDELREKWRYTLSHLAHDVKNQLGVTEPLRDWYPLSASGPFFSDVRDLIDGPNADWGNLKCGCHPNCGIGTMLLVNEKTNEVVPFPRILNVDQIMEDLKRVNDSARGRRLTTLQMALSVIRNYKAKAALPGLGLWDLVKIIDGHNGRRLGIAGQNRYDWRVLLVAGMWFQDLFNYDFRRTEMCIIRLQHGRGLAADRREDVPGVQHQGLVQGEGAPPGLRQGQARATPRGAGGRIHPRATPSPRLRRRAARRGRIRQRRERKRQRPRHLLRRGSRGLGPEAERPGERGPCQREGQRPRRGARAGRWERYGPRRRKRERAREAGRRPGRAQARRQVGGGPDSHLEPLRALS